MGLGALFHVVLALVSGGHEQATNLPALTPREKAALVVVSGLPAPKGVGILVQERSKELPRPRGALVFVDQEGGAASTFDGLLPAGPASSYRSAAEAFGAGKATADGLKEAGVDIDLAPVVDLAGGPLGSRHFSRPAFALAFARGVAVGGSTSCPKHFPGLGSARISTDESPTVRARLLPAELGAFRRAVAGGADCVMVGHAFYRRFGLGSRASFNPTAYRLLRREGFQGAAITDSVSVFGSEWAVPAAKLAVRAGADLILLTSGRDAARVVRALVPLARRGLLDKHVARVLAFRRVVRTS